MTALVPCVPVKAGCFGRSVLTHLRLDTLFVLEMFSQMSDRLAELHRGLCKTGPTPATCAIWTVNPQLVSSATVALALPAANRHIEGKPEPFWKSKHVLHTAQEPV